MNLFAAHCRDGPGRGPSRSEHLASHLDHVEANLHRYLVAGPLRDQAGATVGSLLVIAAENLEDAKAFIAADPYFAAGVWDEVRIEAFSAAAGEWVGGAAWKR